MSDSNTSNHEINETHLGYIQSTITRMGQNSFQAKAWAITIISALITFYLSQDNSNNRATAIILSINVAVLFCFLDTYYLYLERGYRYLYKLVAKITPNSPSVSDYNMDIPKDMRGIRQFLKGFLSISTGVFYGLVVIMLVALLIIKF